MISVNGVELGGTSGSIASTDITDSTSVGRSVLTATDAAAGRAALGFYPRVRAPTSTYPWTLPDAHTLAQVVPTGAQGATSFTDLSANARTVTASSAIVDTTIEGITSTPLYCPAGYLSVDHASASTYVLSTGDFTAEAWITPVGVVSGSPRRIISVGNVDADNGGWTWGLFGDHLNAAVRSGGSNTDYNSTAINALYDGNECFHVALVKTSGVLKMFCRGIPVYSGSCTLAFGVAAKALRIGAREPIATEPPSFRINAVRFSDSARYTDFFIP